ncbi:uncharacterized protein BO97DRAFT_402146, partial [Aspergillus homomorphus CBS 101889]
MIDKCCQSKYATFANLAARTKPLLHETNMMAICLLLDYRSLSTADPVLRLIAKD